MNKILYGIFMVPVALALSFGAVNMISSILAGDISVLEWITNHKFVIGILLSYIIIKYFTPMKYLKK